MKLLEKAFELINKIVEMIREKKMIFKKKEELLKQIIHFQRCLKHLEPGYYDSNMYIRYENKIDDYLKTFFGDEFALIFTKNSVDIYWALRNKSTINDFVIENMLKEFIVLCNKNGFKVQ
ncbi:MAG: hypothetical protein J6Y28_09000 [Acholeplasmatales bacterium]|nr:hypothetical protein [Acholeplasmatales bacterium]